VRLHRVSTIQARPLCCLGTHVCDHLLRHMQALPPEGVTAATQAVITRNAELVEAMAALRCFLRDEHSNLVQVLKLWPVGWHGQTLEQAWDRHPVPVA
jgi:hypothetical protein